MKNSEMLGQFIPLHYHYQMLLDKQRMEGFKLAIESTVKEGSKVLELGCGTGVLSWFAAQKAARVWAVERNPEMVAAAENFLSNNLNGNKVQVIEGDATEYVPDEPVDVVICEMLHSAMLREKQISVIEAFKGNYKGKFGDKLPIFIPDTTFLAVQAVEQDFTFSGYKAPIPVFEPPTAPMGKTKELALPYIYSSCEYKKPLPKHFVCSQEVEISAAGEVNAVRFITKNILSVILAENRTVDWHNFYMILPVSNPFSAVPGDKVKISFSYTAECELQDLTKNLSIKKI